MNKTPQKYILRKPERLGSKLILDDLFMHGESIQVPGMRLLWKKVETQNIASVPARVAFSVPKRLFKKAVTRNLLKRRMREAYRKNKLFPSGSDAQPDDIYYLIFIYTNRKISLYPEIESKIIVTLQRLKTIGVRDKE